MRRTLLVVGLCGVLATPASAESITWEFTIHITDVAAGGTYAALAGTDIFGSFSFESTDWVHHADGGGGLLTGAWTLDVPALDAVWTYAVAGIQMQPEPRCEQFGTCFLLSADQGTSSTDLVPLQGLGIHGNFGFPVGDELLEPPPGEGYTVVFGHNTGTAVGTLPDIHAVPEPSSLLLVGAGLIGAWRRKASCSRPLARAEVQCDSCRRSRNKSLG